MEIDKKQILKDFLEKAVWRTDANGDKHVVTQNKEEFEGKTEVRGHQLSTDMTLDEFIEAYKGMGIQGSVFHKAVQVINKMIFYDPTTEEDYEEEDSQFYHNRRCKKYLGFASFMGTSGTRDIIRYLCEHRMIDIIVTTAGAIEEDLIKCFGDYLVGDFDPALDKQLLEEGYERQGNIFIPKRLQEKFREWFLGQLAELHDWQDADEKNRVTPCHITRHLGLAIGNESSVLYQAAKNDLPIFAPIFTDGFIGEVLYEYNKKRPGLRIDVAKDIVYMNNSVFRTKRSGSIILGGGVSKHHILNANLFRNGCHYSVYVNTGAEFEASDSGAKPTEAISWGKIRIDSEYAKVYSEVSAVLPLLVAATFKKHEAKASRVEEWKEWKAKYLKFEGAGRLF